MTGYNLSNNYIENLEALLRKKRSHAASSSASPPTNELVTPAPFATPITAKTLYDYSIPAVANVLVGLVVNTGNGNFVLQTSLIVMVPALPSEDMNAHLQHFLELYDTIIIKDVEPTSIRQRLFPFSLSGRAK
jgi:hypothetical protein